MPRTHSHSQPPVPAGVVVLGSTEERHDEVLTPQALAFVAHLERAFRDRRHRLLTRREVRQTRLDAGVFPGFLARTKSVREADWQVRPAPKDLQDRRVEITGPVDRKMIINALNSGADVFMADFEDSCSPTWSNVLDGQVNLRDAVSGDIRFDDPRSGKSYALGDDPATLIVRPRGWHLDEGHVVVDGRPVSASLFDFALSLFHNHQQLVQNGSGPYFYLPKLESHLEARLWNAVFVEAQRLLGMPIGTVRATVLIETITAAFEMDEILYELRDHIVGLNCGRWDYIFSFIKRFQKHRDFVLPDRGLVGMTRHFLHSYSLLLIRTCHRRGAHAMGGMAAQIPIKNDAVKNEQALAKVRADKKREATDGHDGTWVAHPGLVAIARHEFDGLAPNQLHKLRDDVEVGAKDLLKVPEGSRTEGGLRENVRVAIVYIEAWLRGNGCVPINHLMEDAATAEISRAQVWQWLHHAVDLEDGRRVDGELVAEIVQEEMSGLQRQIGDQAFHEMRFEEARRLFVDLVQAPELTEFLTIPAYRHIMQTPRPLPAEPNKTPETNGSAWKAERFAGVRRDYTHADVERLQGSVQIEHTLARRGAMKLWSLLHGDEHVAALGAVTGNQAVQMVKAGLQAIYLSGWQVAADANMAGQMYPDQSLYPANSAPMLCKRINASLQRADQIDHMEGTHERDWFVPIVADAEAGFGGPLNAFELMKSMIEASAAGVHFEDQLASEKKCGHLGGKVLVPTQTFIRTLNAARLAADVMDVPTVLVARTDANAAGLLTADVDPRDHEFLTGERTSEGFHVVRPGLDQAISRGLSYAPYADLVWCETASPDLGEAKRFAEAIHAQYPGKLLAYNCSPSFNWAKKLDGATIAKFQRELAAMGYRFQFVTLAGFHSLNHGMFRLAGDYRERGMAAYSDLQQAEFSSEALGYTATRHQREVGTGYFDAVSSAVSGGKSSTTALEGSTEQEQFDTPSEGSVKAG